MGIKPFESEFYGNDLMYGPGCVAQRLDDVLDREGLERALVVCGQNVGANPGVMNPITNGLGERSVGVFDETSTAKSIDTVYDGIDLMRSEDVDVLIGVGSGSSITSVRLMSALEADGRPLGNLRAEVDANRSIAPASFDGQPTPIVTIPTTFAGADLTRGSSVPVSDFDEPPVGESNRISASDRRLLPRATIYDPELFATTPTRILAGSAMNGFDKGLESIYSRYANPTIDANALHGLRLMRSALAQVAAGADTAVLERAVVGSMLVQLDRKTSIIHAFGHAISRRYEVQQGVVHGIVAPHVLEYVLETTDARRTFLAAGLGVDVDSMTTEDAGDAILDALTTLRDSLGTPTQLRTVKEFSRDDFRPVAEYIVDDSPMANAPVGLEPSVSEIEGLLDKAW